MKTTRIINKMLTLTNKLAKLNKKLEAESGAEWLTINAIEKAVHAARTVYEQRLSDKSQD